MNDSLPPALPDPAACRLLLQATHALPWRLEWASQRFMPAGPLPVPVPDWAPREGTSLADWAACIHHDDRERVLALRRAGADHEAEYRLVAGDGSHAWVRDVVHAVRGGDGRVLALAGFLLDIGERRRTEQELLRLQRELEVMSCRDGLTGVANRRMFEQSFEREWASAAREQRPLSLVLLDIDFFKAYNERYGHLAGDDCLRAVATVLQGAAVRPRDLVARFGGEEFVLVLPETDAAAAHHVAERCRDGLAAAALVHAGSPLGAHLTLSIGVATVVPDMDSDQRLFLYAADQALCLAKERGRDRIEVAP